MCYCLSAEKKKDSSRKYQEEREISRSRRTYLSNVLSVKADPVIN